MNNKCKSRYYRLLSCLVLGLFLISVVCVGSVVATPSYVGQTDSHALYDPDTVIVKCYPGTDSKGGLSASSTKTPAEILADYSNLVPGLQLIKLPDGVTVEDAIAYYSKLPGVEYAEPNYYISISATPSDPSYGSQWGLKNAPSSGGISAPAAWDLSTGNDSIIVAVMDTGVDYNHPDLSANMWVNSGEIPNDGIDNDQNGYTDDYHGWNAIYGISDTLDYNTYGHGTHCAGIVGAVTNNGEGIAGTAWNVKIMPVSVLDQFGSGTESSLIAGIEYAVANHADILSMSFGFPPGEIPEKSQAIKEVIDAAGEKGILCVIAAGNAGTNNDAVPVYPASYDCLNIIAVAASDSSNNLASFSNYGARSVDIAAPGVDIYSTVPDVDNNPIDFPAFTDMGVLGAPWSRDVDYAQISGATSSLLYYNQPIYPSGTIIDVGCHLQYKLSSDGYLYYEISKKPFSSYTSIAEFEEDTENVYWLIFDNNYDTQGEYIYWEYWTYPWDEIYKAIGSGPYYIGMYYSSTSSNDFVILDEIEFINYRISSHTYDYLDGTSMATPMVAGAAALIKSIDSSLTPLEIRDIIVNSADKNVGNLGDKTASNGRLNLSAAVLAARPQYTVTFDSNGGSAVPSQNVYYKDTVTKPTDPTKKGYTFEGWYADSKFKTAWDFASDKITAPTTIYANWTLLTYPIAYHLDGGTNSPQNPASYTVETPTITLEKPTKTGYTFTGWHNDSSSGPVITSIPKGSVGERDLYATWTATSYPITYHLNGGVNNVSNPASYTITSPTITLQDPAKAGNTFNGWYSDSEFTHPITSIVSGSTGNVDAYASWTPSTYSISYNLDGGINSPQNPATYTIDTSTITLQDPTKTGYTFIGWHNTSISGPEITSIPKGSTGNRELYAEWTLTTYPITYHLNGGTNAQSNPSSYTYVSPAITFENPTKSGFIFNGWYSDSQYQNHVLSIPVNSTGAVDLYTKWTAKQAPEENVNTSMSWNATIKADIGYLLAGADVSTPVAPMIFNKKSGNSIQLNDNAVVSRQLNGVWAPVDPEYVSIDSGNHVILDSAAGVTISDPVSLEFVGYNLGDADKDGSVTVNDAVRIAQSLVSIIELDEKSMFYGDADSDGSITVNDAVKVSQYLVGLVDGDYNPVK